MSSKPKRPAVFGGLDNFLVRPMPTGEPPASPEPKAPVAQANKNEPEKMFRTSVYFSRAVHDTLRDIAHEERKSVTDLLNEGIDHVLASRNYPTIAELRSKVSRKKT
jgi:hypothetical protein